MSAKSITEIVRGSPIRLINHAFQCIKPDETCDLPVEPLKAKSTHHSLAYLHGAELHEAFDRGNRGLWVDPKYWPYVRTFKAWMSKIGVRTSYSEWEFRGARKYYGFCDLLAAGGPNHRGVVEFKLTWDMPEVPENEDLYQLSLYSHSASERFCDRWNYWGALAYVHPDSHSMRLFLWRSMKAGCESANWLAREAA